MLTVTAALSLAESLAYLGRQEVQIHWILRVSSLRSPLGSFLVADEFLIRDDYIIQR